MKNFANKYTIKKPSSIYELGFLFILLKLGIIIAGIPFRQK